MITALVHYKQLIEAPHPMLDDTWEKRSKVVEVKKLIDLNHMFRHISKIDVLKCAHCANIHKSVDKSNY